MDNVFYVHPKLASVYHACAVCTKNFFGVYKGFTDKVVIRTFIFESSRNTGNTVHKVPILNQTRRIRENALIKEE